jgi:prephenate dehydratase
VSDGPLRVGVLGGPGTFAWQAYRLLSQTHPWLGDARYLGSVEELLAALTGGELEAICLAVETSRGGFTPVADLLLQGRSLQVVAEALVPYRCTLYIKEGSSLAQVRPVLGHRSLELAQDWLRANLPGATSEARASSLEAARQVAQGDGSLAVVGSPSLPQFVPGLAAAAQDIDGGASARWWVLSRRPRAEAPCQRVVLVAEALAAAGLLPLLQRSAALGLRLEGLHCQPAASFRYHYLLLAGAEGESLRPEDLAALSSETVRVAGAFPLRAGA